MKKYEENISDNSIWITATPTQLTQTLPFYISEAGHFMAAFDYSIKRDMHDSFLILYTISGQGIIKTNETLIRLPHAHTVLIDCHSPHEYYSDSGNWEFLWIHSNGSGVKSFFDIIYPDKNVRSVNIISPQKFENKIKNLINTASKNDIAGCIDISSNLHTLLNTICLSALENENVNIKKEPADDIRTVVNFIENNYSEPITIDDMVGNIHISKYHFIRRFRRTMGTTPYNYLTTHRITIAKTLLRSTDKTVAEISEMCGFLDTSNFITHFKKHTGQKPLQYRRDFS